MPALEPLDRAAGRRRPGRARRRALDRRRRTCPSSCGSPPTRRSPSARPASTLDDPDAIVEDERGYVGAWCPFDAIRPQTEWSPPTDRPALAQGSVAGRARQGLVAGRRRCAGRRDRGPCRRPRRAPRVAAMTYASQMVDTLLPIRWPDRPKPSYDVVIIGGRRARPVHRLLPRDPPRHHERGGPRGRLHRVRQHRPEHDDHPRELRHPPGGPLLQAQPGHVRRARGRDRREPAPPDPRDPVVRPHRDDDADRTGARRAQPGARRRDGHGHAE